MERTFGQDERIRRAEEIYLRRQNLKNRTQRVTVSTNNEPKNLKLFRKLILQILICIALYYIFHLISTTNYSFSEDTLNKAKELLSHDLDFQGMYTIVVENINNYLYSEENQDNEQTEENKNEENKEEETENNTNNDEQNTEEGVNQQEVSFTEESETERIKHNYSFILPLNGGVISSEFGDREVTASVMTAYHKGIDIAADTGTSITAATEGTVVISKYSQSYGNYVMIQKDEVKTVYAHCSERLVKEGDNVTQGQEIAKVGATGDVTGAHLHFEIRINDVCVDPRLILNFEETKNAG